MPLRVLFSLVMVFCFSQAVAQPSEGENRFSLEQPGILIITAGSDTSAGFHWRREILPTQGPGVGRISLVWEGGVLSIPETLALDGFPNNNLGVPLEAGFSGTGQEGPLLLADGVFSVTESLMMGDGVVQLMISDGELEIFGPRFRYSRPREITADEKQKANFLLIAGLLVLIAVLLRRARKILRKGA